MPTGWRPADVKEKYPYSVIEDVYRFTRYKTPATPFFKGYVIFQMIFTLALLLFMFYNYSEIGFQGLLVFGAYVYLGIYGYTTLMDRSSYAFIIELVRSIAGILLIFFTGDWFGLNQFVSNGQLIMVSYFLITAAGGFYFTYIEKTEAERNLAI